MKTMMLSTTAALALLAGVVATSATTVTTTTTRETTGAVTIEPEVESEVRTYVTRENWRSVDVPSGVSIAVGAELPSTIELRTVPKVERYRVAVVGGRTVLVDPGTRKIVRIIESR
jgi:hypothetical protein